MANVHPLINNMTGGVISDELSVRSDWENYKKSMKRLINFGVKPYGGVYRRHGSERLGAMKYPDKKVRLIKFVRANYDTFILEFGHLYMRVWRDYQPYMNGASQWEIVTPYTEDDVGRLQWVQSNDVMWIVDGVHKPQKLTRSGTAGANTWAIAPFAPTADPFTGTDFPAVISMYNERLVMANTPSAPQKMWFSGVGDFENYTVSTSVDTSALTFTLATSEVCAIRWMTVYQDKCYIGTHSTIHTLDISDTSRTMTIKNYRFSQQQTFGCKPIVARQISQALLFVKRDGRSLQELIYEQATGTMTALNRNLTSPHMVKGKIKEIEWQQNPFSTMWCVMEDGTLSGMTYLREQNVFAWHQHVLGCNADGAFVESVSVLPSRSEDVDDVFFAVKRKVNGAWVRTLEVIKGVADEDAVSQDLWNYLDCGTLKTFATPTSVVTGLSAYEGETLTGFADGYVIDGQPLVVTGGQVTLPRPATNVRLGYNYRSLGETLPVDAGGAMGSAQGIYKRISAIRLHLYKSLGGKYGYDENKLNEIFTYKNGLVMGKAPAPESGVKEKTFPGTWDREGTIIFVQDQPLPFNIMAIGMDLQTNG